MIGHNSNKKLILVFFVVLLVIISGCKNTGTQKSITDEDVRKGAEGLTIEFIKNAPPDKVFEDSIFSIVLRLKNKGADDVPSKDTNRKGFLVMGLEKTYMSIQNPSDEKKEINVKGKSILNLNGDEEFVEIKAKTSKVGAQSETHPSTILATACYPYRTILGASVCVDGDIFGTKLRNKACQVKDLQFSNGQGAPVAITKIESRMLPDADSDKIKPHFIIHIENKGNGEVINLEKIDEACSNKPLTSKDFNIIKISASLSNQDLNCNVGGDIGGELSIPESKLRQKKSVARCTLEEGIQRSQDAYTAPLRIELQYGYIFTISKDIIIEKILIY